MDLNSFSLSISILGKAISFKTNDVAPLGLCSVVSFLPGAAHLADDVAPLGLCCVIPFLPDATHLAIDFTT
jgi:hypothetical protein